MEKKLENPSFNGIIESGLKDSVFGVFGHNYKMYKNTPRKDGFGGFL